MEEELDTGLAKSTEGGPQVSRRRSSRDEFGSSVVSSVLCSGTVGPRCPSRVPSAFPWLSLHSHSLRSHPLSCLLVSDFEFPFLRTQEPRLGVSTACHPMTMPHLTRRPTLFFFCFPQLFSKTHPTAWLTETNSILWNEALPNCRIENKAN